MSPVIEVNSSNASTIACEELRSSRSGEDDLVPSTPLKAEKISIRRHGPSYSAYPAEWSATRRWLVTFTACFTAIVTGVRAGAYGAGNREMEILFNINQSSFPWLFFGTTAWGVGGAFIPLFFIIITDGVGRRGAYFSFYAVFLICLIPCSLAKNFATMIISRIIGSGASVAAVAVVGGMIKDLWKDIGARQYNIATGLFGNAIIVGIALGPFIGAVIERHLTWRWIYHIQLIFDCCCVPFFVLTLRETKTPFILIHQISAIPDPSPLPKRTRYPTQLKSILTAMYESPMKPTHMTFTEPLVFLCWIWVGYAWGILFLLTQSVPQTFSKTYAFSLLSSNTAYLAVGAGSILASCSHPIQDHIWLRSARRNKENPGQPIPEARFYLAIPGQLIFSAGLFLYGWTSQRQFHWFVPICGLAMVGYGIYTTYMSVYHYCTDVFYTFSAAANGATSFSRFLWCGFLGLAWTSLSRRLGIQWAASCLAFIGLALTLAPVIIVVCGRGMRRRSGYTIKTFEEGRWGAGKAAVVLEGKRMGGEKKKREEV